VTVRVWQFIVALVSVLGVIALPSRFAPARATTSVSPNCAQRAAHLALVTAATTGYTRPTVRRASTVLGETARPLGGGPTIPPRPPTAWPREGGQHYSYDENGNLTARDTQSLSYDAGNRLQQLGDTTFERDRNGQLIRQTSPERDDRYEWDALGQLRCVHHRDGAETRFGYDAFGRRIFKHHQPATAERAPDPLARFAWATGPLPGEPRNPERTAPRHLITGRTQYFWAGDDLLAEAREGQLTEYAMWGFVSEALWENGQLRHVVNSQQGVPQELVDPNGKLIWQGTFDDWGKLIAEKGSTTCRLRLPGQLADDETGLHYNRFRYYSPEAGQFVSADPIGFEAGYNEYRFAANALSWLDPLGLSCKKDGCTDLTEHRAEHILNRHKAGAGKTGKTEFPARWSDQDILHHVSDVATDPASTTGMGKWDSPFVVGTRDGIEIRVDFYPSNHPLHSGKISTAYPINVPPNP
jgi:RHS repeat-associated protein